MMIDSCRTYYNNLTDQEVVSMIVTPPYNDEAAVYMIYSRYELLIRKIYMQIYNHNDSWYDDCRNDLFQYLKGKNNDWQSLRSFEWKCKFSTWIDRTAWNRFAEIRPYLTGKFPDAISLDDVGDENEDRPPAQLPDEGVEAYEERERRVLLMEAIGALKDADQRFVILKRLEGYNSVEIADLLQQSWTKHGIEKYDVKGNRVVPSPAYVDVRTQRAKEHLKAYILKNN